MNPTVHSEISAKKWGGKPEDYYFLHSFMDKSKNVCSTNSHRALSHHLFFINEVVVPIFGHTIKNSEGRDINVKDMLESDHVLADFRGKFIPNLSDWAQCIEIKEDEAEEVLKKFETDNKESLATEPEIDRLLKMPFYLTGMRNALFFTYNSWFAGFILPQVFKKVINIVNPIQPSYFFNKMRYEGWMQNGDGYPPSYAKILESRRNRETSLVPEKSNVKVDWIEDVNLKFEEDLKARMNPVYDGSQGSSSGLQSYYVKPENIDSAAEKLFADKRIMVNPNFRNVGHFITD